MTKVYCMEKMWVEWGKSCIGMMGSVTSWDDLLHTWQQENVGSKDLGIKRGHVNRKGEKEWVGKEPSLSNLGRDLPKWKKKLENLKCKISPLILSNLHFTIEFFFGEYNRNILLIKLNEGLASHPVVMSLERIPSPWIS